MQRSHRIHFKVEKWNLGGPIVRRLRRGVNNQIRLQFCHEIQNGVAIAYVNRGMAVVWNLSLQLPKHPACIAFRAKEDGSMVAVDSRHGESKPGKPACDFGTDQPARARYKNFSTLSHQTPPPLSF